jgi:hypothetical protein
MGRAYRADSRGRNKGVYITIIIGFFGGSCIGRTIGKYQGAYIASIISRSASIHITTIIDSCGGSYIGTIIGM